MNSAFMDVTVFYGGMPKPKTFKNAICIFERHTGDLLGQGGSKGHKATQRTQHASFSCPLHFFLQTLPSPTSPPPLLPPTHPYLILYLHLPVQTDVPLMRHYSSTFKFYGAVPGAELVVRMMSTVYNIDYIHDLELSVGGGINVKVYTSGYVQTGPLRPSYPKHHGYPLFHDVAGV